KIATRLLMLSFAMVPCLTGEAQVLTPVGYSGVCHLSDQEYFLVHAQGVQYLGFESRYTFESPESRTGYRVRSAPFEEPLDPPAALGCGPPLPAGAAKAAPPSTDLVGELYDFTRPSSNQIRSNLRAGRPVGWDRSGESMLADSLEQTQEGGLSWTLLEGQGN